MYWAAVDEKWSFYCNVNLRVFSSWRKSWILTTSTAYISHNASPRSDHTLTHRWHPPLQFCASSMGVSLLGVKSWVISVAHSPRPRSQATWSAVFPSWSCSPRLAPLSTSRRTTTVWFRYVARCNGLYRNQRRWSKEQIKIKSNWICHTQLYKTKSKKYNEILKSSDFSDLVRNLTELFLTITFQSTFMVMHACKQKQIIVTHSYYKVLLMDKKRSAKNNNRSKTD